ncbi:UNVERIFIED_CONTAM: cytochrome C, partial [Salmonella enterica subsp. enterica serovar Weltevreden]
HDHGPFFDPPLKTGRALSLRYKITNIDKGHNLPSGSLGAQPELWFNVALINPEGKRVWESGYVDEHGDMADIHSLGVAKGTTPYDHQLFNLQTKFLTTN